MFVSVSGAVGEQQAMHGEGAHAGDLSFARNHDGIDYIASAHGDTAVSYQILVKIGACSRGRDRGCANRLIA
jgi:hypothetical protein